MENKEFQIIPLQGRSLLVVILSSEMTNYYWKELQTELANLNIADAEVYFDFLYRNGLKNRFFKSKLKGMMLISNSLRKCEAPKEYIKVADTFLFYYKLLCIPISFGKRIEGTSDIGEFGDVTINFSIVGDIPKW